MTTPGWPTPNYIVVEAEAAIVRRVFDLYTTDRLGTRAIASVLNMCWSRNRYGASKGCDIHRFNADELEAAIGQALLDLYTTGHDIIEQAISAFLTSHHQATGARHGELASIKQQLRENTAAVDRYLTAFEKGTLDDEDPDIQARLTNLRIQSKQLRADKARLEFDFDQPPTGPTPEAWH